MKRLILILATFLVAFGELSAREVQFKDNGEALVNPGMGFCHYAYAGRLWAYGSKNPAWDTLDWFPGCSTVYMRLLWCDLEPEEGVYRWDILDRYMVPWAAAGKKIALRIISCNQTRNAVPDYVREAGAKGRWFQYKQHKVEGSADNFPERWEPDYECPIFLEKLATFLKAFAERYDGNPNIAFVDVGSFGIYGEAHSEYLNDLFLKDPDEYLRLAKLHVKIWKDHLPNTYLIVTDDFRSINDPNIPHHKVLYAQELGMGLRDDSVFCHKGRNWHHDAWARIMAENTPVIIETGHLTAIGPDSVDPLKNEWQDSLIVKCIEDNRASYFSIHDYPELHLKRHRAVIEAANMRLGYRLVPEMISYPDEVKVGEPVEIVSRWHNAGVAKCYGGGKLQYMLLDKKGNICWSVIDDGFNVRSLEPTLDGVVKSQTVKTKLYFGYTEKIPVPDNAHAWAVVTGREPGDVLVMLPEGTYTLCVAVAGKNGVPEIALPIKGDSERRIYPVGKIRINPMENPK